MSFKSRLLLYVAMLIVLLMGMMTLSFRTARDVVSVSAEEQLRNAALRKQDSVRAQRQELMHYVDLVADDLRLKEYLGNLAVRQEGQGLADYYSAHFSSLPVDSALIISTNGEVLLGGAFPPLVDGVRERYRTGRAKYFYLESPEGVVLVAMSPVIHHNRRLATVAVARIMDQQWLHTEERHSDDYLLLFERGGNVLWSSDPTYQGLSINLTQQSLSTENQHFQLQEVSLENDRPMVPRLWFGASRTRVIDLLERYQRWVYIFAVLGGGAVLMVGGLILRNFNRPFQQLMHTTEEMIDGKLPVMSRSESNTEMDRLVNRFADVLDALRREQSELKRVHKRLQETAITDSLTGLYNRRYLQEVSPALFAQVERDGRYLTSILLDLDHFKEINDRHGHLGGDAVLVHFARLLKHNSRVNDYLFRIGGEEFLILNVTATPPDSAVLAEKIRVLVHESPANYRGFTIPITVSAGVSCCFGEVGESSLSRLMRNADKALYNAKAGGRNRVVAHASCEFGQQLADPPAARLALVKSEVSTIS